MAEFKYAVVNCYIEKRVSKKNNSVYSVLVLVFENGYKCDMFLNNEQIYILGQIVPSVN